MLTTNIYDRTGNHFGCLAETVQITMEGTLAILPSSADQAKLLVAFGGTEHPVSKLVSFPLTAIHYFNATSL